MNITAWQQAGRREREWGWGKEATHHHQDVLYLSNTDVRGAVGRQPQVEKVVLVGHRTQFHQRHRVALVETALVLIGLQRGVPSQQGAG